MFNLFQNHLYDVQWDIMLVWNQIIVKINYKTSYKLNKKRLLLMCVNLERYFVEICFVLKYLKMAGL